MKQTNIQKYSHLCHSSAQNPPEALGSLRKMPYYRILLDDPSERRQPPRRSGCCCVPHSLCSSHTGLLHFLHRLEPRCSLELLCCYFLFPKCISSPNGAFVESFKVTFTDRLILNLQPLSKCLISLPCFTCSLPHP